MNAIKKLLAVTCFGLVMPLAVEAEISQFVSVTSNPNNTSGTAVRDGSIPPQPGVELFVLNPLSNLLLPPDLLPEPPYGTEYTLTFKTTEQPGAVVAIPGKVASYTYTENTSGDASFPHTLQVVFTHERYAGGVEAELPGPVSDFAIAIIPAVADGQNGPPAAMRGSYMATNISPLAWTLIPPSQSTPSFGYEISGNNGASAYFDFFVPDGLIAALSTLLGRPLSQDDLALFSNNNQASIGFERVEGTNPGALIEVSLTFDAATNEVTDIPEESGAYLSRALTSNESELVTRAGTVTKKLTVGAAPALSIGATKKTVKAGKKVRLYGWAKNGTPGEKVSILSQSLISSRGVKNAVVKRAVLDSERKYVASFKVFSTDSYKVTHKSAAGVKSTSKKLKVTVR